jgi:uncharacterized protein
MQMSLGLFMFSLPTIVFQDLKHKRDVRYAANERIGNPDAWQFIGPGRESISLSGNTAHGINRPSLSYALLNRMMQAGKAYPLIDGLGNVYGQYIILSIDTGKGNFRKFGQPIKTDFTIELQRVDNPGGAIRNVILDAALDRLRSPLKMIANKLSIASLGPKVRSELKGLKL